MHGTAVRVCPHSQASRGPTFSPCHLLGANGSQKITYRGTEWNSTRDPLARNYLAGGGEDGLRFESWRGMDQVHSSIQMPASRMASYMASGERSAPFDHSTVPCTILADANTAGSRRGSNTVPSTLREARRACISTSPVVPSTKLTRRRLFGSTVTDTTRHGTVWRIGGSTSEVRWLSGSLVRGTGPNPPSTHRDVRSACIRVHPRAISCDGRRR